jgi:molecular chaperone DnaK (HSP70)
MKEEAKAHADDDAKKKQLADEKNTADMMIFTAEKTMKIMEIKFLLKLRLLSKKNFCC